MQISFAAVAERTAEKFKIARLDLARPQFVEVRQFRQQRLNPFDRFPLAVDLDPVIARNQPDAEEILQIAQIFHLVSGAGRMKRQPLFKVKSAFDIHR